MATRANESAPVGTVRGLADRSARHLGGPRVSQFWNFALCLSERTLTGLTNERTGAWRIAERCTPTR